MGEATKRLIDSLREGAANAVQTARDVSNSRGAAPLHALVRQGADELGSVLPAFPDSMKTQPELGGIFEPTPQMVTENLTGNRPDYLSDRLGPTAHSVERQPQKEMER